VLLTLLQSTGTIPPPTPDPAGPLGGAPIMFTRRPQPRRRNDDDEVFLLFSLL
jgi:hypothetical protein